MIKYFLLSAIVLYSAFAERTDFISQDWDSTLKTAQKTNKPIFLDAYTHWCGWCKVMDNKTFTDPKVKEFLDNNFVAAKIDMEDGVGRKLAMKYHVDGFPSFLFFDSNGNFAYKVYGYLPPDNFIGVLKKGLAKVKEPLSGYSDTLDVPFPDFYKKAFLPSGDPGKTNPDIQKVSSFLNKQDDLFSEISWAVMYRFPTTDAANSFFLNNLEKYRELYGSVEIMRKFENILQQKLAQAIADTSEEKLQEIDEIIERYTPTQELFYKTWMKTRFYKRTKKWDKYFDVANNFFQNAEPDMNYQVYSIAKTVYLNIDDKEKLEITKNKMAQVIENEKSYLYLDIYASLLFETGNLKKAKEFAQKAIEYGKNEGTDYSKTKELLEQINEEL